MRFLLFLTLLCTLTACGDSSEPAPATYDANDATTSDVSTSAPAPGVTPRPAVKANGEIAASTFTEFPAAQVDGCNCTLRLDPQPGSDADIFFSFNWQQGPGVIGINGKNAIVQRTNGRQTDATTGRYTHENEQFSVTTSLLTEGPSEGEVIMYSGTVRVQDKTSGAELRARVSGTCGC